jgi:hypothetical protein
MHRSMIAAFLVAALAPAALAAQQPFVLSGRVVDQMGQPVSGLVVLLHRVTTDSGASIGQAESDSTGAFTFRLDETPTDDAVYFAAAHYHDSTYIGAFEKPPIDATIPYVIMVGGPGVDFGAPGPSADGQPGSAVQSPLGPSRWTLALIPLVALLGLAAAMALSRRRALQRRHLLIRLAVLEEQAATGGDTDALQQERARILDQLGGAHGG